MKARIPLSVSTETVRRVIRKAGLKWRQGQNNVVLNNRIFIHSVHDFAWLVSLIFCLKMNSANHLGQGIIFFANFVGFCGDIPVSRFSLIICFPIISIFALLVSKTGIF